MNYGQVRDQVLKLLDQYSVAGARVEPSYNNQQDYLNRIPGLVNDAMMEIATGAKKIPAVLHLGSLPREEEGEKVRYELPGDFYQLRTGSIVRDQKGEIVHTNCYMLQGKRCLILPKEEDGNYALEYDRYPMLLGERPQDSDELDNAPETHYAIPFYVAAFLVDRDDPYLCALFHNKYADKLAGMGAGLTAEVRPVADSYQFFQ